ncbi:hypothetical protein BIW11_05264 [Tropilaelaps mercedesae]|uniref:Uncharacterized protein n=1 Tax=Tropilaelaps mercedesae TaxID=418985 RepID=A0A1V9Y373_9ACAR|nr:hypothetical protein BIW11_05264 [Tropilaelaps mercedesae]
MKSIAIVLLVVAIMSLMATAQQQQRQRGGNGGNNGSDARGDGAHATTTLEDRDQKLLDCLKKMNISLIEAQKIIQFALIREGKDNLSGMSSDQRRKLLDCLTTHGVSTADAHRDLKDIADVLSGHKRRVKATKLSDVVHQGREGETEDSKRSVKS